MNYLKELVDLSGVSGNEEAVAEFIVEKLRPYVDTITIFPLGDVIGFKKGRGTTPKKIMVAAHMDEVGFIVTHITGEGLLQFSPVGGIDPQVILGQRVLVGDKKILGLVGNCPIHLLSPSQRKSKAKFSDLTIDIGAKNQEEAEKLVSLGDLVSFSSDFVPLGDGYWMGKALDDRGGCAILLELAKESYLHDLYFTFTTREEVGGMGATVVANTINPDYGLVVEFTTAGDNLGKSGQDLVCQLGKGVVISFMDQGTIYDRTLYQKAVQKAEEEKIPWQTKTGIFGANDSKVIHTAGSGVKTIAFSVPSRNLHTGSIVIKEEDYKGTLALSRQFLQMESWEK